MICEEAAYMDLGVFYEVVVPILEMEDACIIFITTPLGSFNFHSAFGQLRDAKGRKVINCIKVGLICKRCRESDHPEQCPHMKGRRPKWKSEDKFNDVIKVLMADQLTLLRREAMGEIADDGELAFQPAKVNLALNEEQQRTEQELISTYSPQVLFLSVDPTGEGSSKFAIHTDYYRSNRQYVRTFSLFYCLCLFYVQKKLLSSSSRRSGFHETKLFFYW